MLLFGLIQILLILFGLAFGIVAWVSTKRHGKEGVLGKAIAGTCINGALILVALLTIPGVIMAGWRAKAHQLTARGSLVNARRNYATRLLKRSTSGYVPPYAPGNLFRRIKYPSEPGDMYAYVSPDPKDGKRHPAIVWLAGGFDNSISEVAWTPQPADNDQSGSAFWKQGVITMYPGLRGGNINPGVKEGFYGEVDDVRAGAEFLANQSYVDPARIYLGGHSTGGTLAILVSETCTNFRAVFSFGPVSDIRGYGAANLPFDVRDSREVEVRSPIFWLNDVRTPTFVFEGTQPRSNISELKKLESASANPLIRFYSVKGLNHFSILAPVSTMIATKILADTGPASKISFSTEEIQVK